MKLIMENWRGYLTEEEMRSQIIAYLEENNITLTEEEIEEAMPRWMKKLGTGMAFAAASACPIAPWTSLPNLNLAVKEFPSSDGPSSGACCCWVVS